MKISLLFLLFATANGERSLTVKFDTDIIDHIGTGSVHRELLCYTVRGAETTRVKFELIAIPDDGEMVMLTTKGYFRLHQIPVVSFNTTDDRCFYVHGRHVGKTIIKVMIGAIWLDDNSTFQAVQYIPVKVHRIRRPPDTILEICLTIVVIINAMGMGLFTTVKELKDQFKEPKPVLIGIGAQYFLLPLGALMIAEALSISKDHAIGLVYTSCLPGGGLGHVLVCFQAINERLSLTMNMLSSVLPLLTAPLWLYLIGELYTLQNPIDNFVMPLGKLELWLFVISAAYVVGLAVNRFFPAVAQGILTWFIQPFLLLCFMLFITLGNYINLYIFKHFDNVNIVASMLMPAFGIMIGGAVSVKFLAKNDAKCIATETALSNGLAAFVAIRQSFPQPEADLASAMCIWMVITCLIPFLAAKVFLVIKRRAFQWWEIRKAKQDEHLSIFSALEATTSLTLASQVVRKSFPGAATPKRTSTSSQPLSRQRSLNKSNKSTRSDASTQPSVFTTTPREGLPQPVPQLYADTSITPMPPDEYCARFKNAHMSPVQRAMLNSSQKSPPPLHNSFNNPMLPFYADFRQTSEVPRSYDSPILQTIPRRSTLANHLDRNGGNGILRRASGSSTYSNHDTHFVRAASENRTVLRRAQVPPQIHVIPTKFDMSVTDFQRNRLTRSSQLTFGQRDDETPGSGQSLDYTTDSIESRDFSNTPRRPDDPFTDERVIIRSSPEVARRGASFRSFDEAFVFTSTENDSDDDDDNVIHPCCRDDLDSELSRLALSTHFSFDDTATIV